MAKYQIEITEVAEGGAAARSSSGSSSSSSGRPGSGTSSSLRCTKAACQPVLSLVRAHTVSGMRVKFVRGHGLLGGQFTPINYS